MAKLYSIAIMNKATTLLRLEQKIEKVRHALQAIAPMHPGSISGQYQVCGRPGCRCADPENPERHGPYYKLSYVYRGKPVCRFVRAGCVAKLQKRLEAHKKFRSLMDQWIKLSIEQGRVEFFDTAGKKPPRRKG